MLLYVLAPESETREGQLTEKKPAESDLDLFRREVEGVRPLKAPPRSDSRAPQPEPRPRQRELDERRVLDELLDDPGPVPGLETGEELRFLRPGYQQRYLRRLMRGQYALADHLDLHHMTVDTARQVLLEFIAASIGRGHGCVRVVHGKGLRSKKGPRIKQMVNRLLRRHPAVIAFSSCRPVDGGTGAVAVLLKR